MFRPRRPLSADKRLSVYQLTKAYVAKMSCITELLLSEPSSKDTIDLYIATSLYTVE